MEGIIKIIALGIAFAPLAHLLALVAVIFLIKLYFRSKRIDAKIDDILLAVRTLQKDKN